MTDKCVACGEVAEGKPLYKKLGSSDCQVEVFTALHEMQLLSLPPEEKNNHYICWDCDETIAEEYATFVSTEAKKKAIEAKRKKQDEVCKLKLQKKLKQAFKKAHVEALKASGTLPPVSKYKMKEKERQENRYHASHCLMCKCSFEASKARGYQRFTLQKMIDDECDVADVLKKFGVHVDVTAEQKRKRYICCQCYNKVRRNYKAHSRGEKESSLPLKIQQGADEMDVFKRRPTTEEHAAEIAKLIPPSLANLYKVVTEEEGSKTTQTNHKPQNEKNPTKRRRRRKNEKDLKIKENFSSSSSSSSDDSSSDSSGNSSSSSSSSNSSSESSSDTEEENKSNFKKPIKKIKSYIPKIKKHKSQNLRTKNSPTKSNETKSNISAISTLPELSKTPTIRTLLPKGANEHGNCDSDVATPLVMSSNDSDIIDFGICNLCGLGYNSRPKEFWFKLSHCMPSVIGVTIMNALQILDSELADVSESVREKELVCKPCFSRVCKGFRSQILRRIAEEKGIDVNKLELSKIKVKMMNSFLDKDNEEKEIKKVNGAINSKNSNNVGITPSESKVKGKKSSTNSEVQTFLPSNYKCSVENDCEKTDIVDSENKTAKEPKINSKVPHKPDKSDISNGKLNYESDNLSKKEIKPSSDLNIESDLMKVSSNILKCDENSTTSKRKKFKFKRCPTSFSKILTATKNDLDLITLINESRHLRYKGNVVLLHSVIVDIADLNGILPKSVLKKRESVRLQFYSDIYQFTNYRRNLKNKRNWTSCILCQKEGFGIDKTTLWLEDPVSPPNLMVPLRWAQLSLDPDINIAAEDGKVCEECHLSLKEKFGKFVGSRVASSHGLNSEKIVLEKYKVSFDSIAMNIVADPLHPSNVNKKEKKKEKRTEDNHSHKDGALLCSSPEKIKSTLKVDVKADVIKDKNDTVKFDVIKDRNDTVEADIIKSRNNPVETDVIEDKNDTFESDVIKDRNDSVEANVNENHNLSHLMSSQSEIEKKSHLEQSIFKDQSNNFDFNQPLESGNKHHSDIQESHSLKDKSIEKGVLEKSHSRDNLSLDLHLSDSESEDNSNFNGVADETHSELIKEKNHENSGSESSDKANTKISIDATKMQKENIPETLCNGDIKDINEAAGSQEVDKSSKFDTSIDESKIKDHISPIHVSSIGVENAETKSTNNDTLEQYCKTNNDFGGDNDVSEVGNEGRHEINDASNVVEKLNENCETSETSEVLNEEANSKISKKPVINEGNKSENIIHQVSVGDEEKGRERNGDDSRVENELITKTSEDISLNAREEIKDLEVMESMNTSEEVNKDSDIQSESNDGENIEAPNRENNGEDCENLESVINDDKGNRIIKKRDGEILICQSNSGAEVPKNKEIEKVSESNEGGSNRIQNLSEVNRDIKVNNLKNNTGENDESDCNNFEENDNSNLEGSDNENSHSHLEKENGIENQNIANKCINDESLSDLSCLGASVQKENPPKIVLVDICNLKESSSKERSISPVSSVNVSSKSLSQLNNLTMSQPEVNENSDNDKFPSDIVNLKEVGEDPEVNNDEPSSSRKIENKCKNFESKKRNFSEIEHSTEGEVKSKYFKADDFYIGIKNREAQYSESDNLDKSKCEESQRENADYHSEDSNMSKEIATTKRKSSFENTPKLGQESSVSEFSDNYIDNFDDTDNEFGEDSIAPFAQRKRFKAKSYNIDSHHVTDKEMLQQCMGDIWQTLQGVNLDDLIYQDIDDPLRLSQWNIGFLLALNDLRVHLGASLENLMLWLKRLLPIELRVKGMKPSIEKFSNYLLSLSNCKEEQNSKLFKQILPEDLFICTKTICSKTVEERRPLMKCYIEDVRDKSFEDEAIHWEDFLKPVNLDDLFSGKPSRVSWKEFNNGLLYALWKVNKLMNGDEDNFIKLLSLTSTAVMKEKNYLAMSKAASAIDKHLQEYPEEINRLVAPIVVRSNTSNEADNSNPGKGVESSDNSDSSNSQQYNAGKGSIDEDVIFEKETDSKIKESQIINSKTVLGGASHVIDSIKHLSNKKTARVLPQPPNIVGVSNDKKYPYISSNVSHESVLPVNKINNQDNKTTLTPNNSINYNGPNSFTNSNSSMNNLCSMSNFIPPEVNIVANTNSNSHSSLQPQLNNLNSGILNPNLQPIQGNKTTLPLSAESQSCAVNNAVESTGDIANSPQLCIQKIGMLSRPQFTSGINSSSGLPLIPVLNSSGFMTMVPLSMRMATPHNKLSLPECSLNDSNKLNPLQIVTPTQISPQEVRSSPPVVIEQELASKVTNLERQLQEIQKQNSQLLEMNQKLLEKTLHEKGPSETHQGTHCTSKHETLIEPSISNEPSQNRIPTAPTAYIVTPSFNKAKRGRPLNSSRKSIKGRDPPTTKKQVSFEDALNYSYKK